MNYRIQFEQWVAAPLEQVFPFFSNPSNLPRIMPPGLRTRLVRLRLMCARLPARKAAPITPAWLESDLKSSPLSAFFPGFPGARSG